MASAQQVDPPDLLIIEQLRAAGAEGHVSGAALGEELGISRAAVGKRVNLLREQGFAIEATPRLGYRLTAEPDQLHPLVLDGLLRTQWLGRSYTYREAADSTNGELAAAAREGAPHGAVLLAESQPRGRGRLGRSWFSESGRNLTFSLVLRPDCAPAALPPLTLAAAVGVARGIEPFLGAPPIVKWPNDILAPDGRKLCGILTELAAEIDRVQHLVVGIGLNVNQTRFPSSITTIASSLRAVTGRRQSRVEVLASVLGSLELWFDRLLHGDEQGLTETLEEWLSLAPWIGQAVRVQTGGEELEAIATGLDTTGALVLDVAGEEMTVLAADISLKL